MVEDHSHRRRWRPATPSYAGIIGAVTALWLSLLPSLLPLPWLYLGLASGGSMVFGYAVGSFVGWAVRRVLGREPPASVMRIAWWALAVAAVAATAGAALAGHAWQNEVRRLVGEEPLGLGSDVAVLAVAVSVALVLIAAGRLLRLGARWIAGRLARWLPRRAGIAIAWLIVAAIVVLVGNGVLLRSLESAADGIYRSKNEGTPPGIERPTESERSGSPASLVSWASLGYQGRNFVGRGPSQSDLREFNEAEPRQPIRVYVGLDSAATVEARAALVVRELERTGAFDRALLCVATPTGTGWLEPQSVDTLEYLYNGDTAIAAIQYSYLPSWISFLLDPDDAQAAGRALYAAVYDRWSELPETSRPRLIAYGLSLGSYGMQAAFSGVQDLQTRTQGALFSGTPDSTELWAGFTAERDAGSPQWLPVLEDGETVRFAAASADFARPHARWHSPRVIYLQHASDPIIWWSWKLLLQRPDWLREPHGRDISPHMHWFPFVTWAQVSVDQFVGTLVPPGHGHNYGNMMVSAFVTLLSPPGWDQQKTEALQAVIDEYPIE